MGKRIFLFMVVALAAIVIVPAVALAQLPPTYNQGLTNDYGQHFAGQSYCLACHGSAYADTVHSRFVTNGLVPSPPSDWTVFQSAGGNGQQYSITANVWITLGDYLGGAGTEYAYWTGSTSAGTLPYTMVEGLSADPTTGEFTVSADGLSSSAYSCYQCHDLGPTTNGAGVPGVPDATATAASKGWARPVGTTATDFDTTQSVTVAGMGIQCEKCHGTGTEATVDQGGHFNTGTKLSSGNPGDSSLDIEVLLNSQVCGQCHASYTNTDDQGNPTQGLFGYTPDKRLADYVNVSGTPTMKISPSGQPSATITRAPYTYIPTEAQFEANPLLYSMFPNGDNATGHHFYYNEWEASAHSWRGALTPKSPDASAYQKLGESHYTVSMAPISSGCYKCHTGEGFLESKNAPVAQYLPSPSATTVGFMGTECVTCHTGHPSSTNPDAAGVLRAPDQAGQRSCTGLTTSNTSICEDCHNWQYETQGLKSPLDAGFDFVPVAAANLNSTHTPDHPQRETLHGRSMVEIPQASEFMPNVTCVDCHMPKTNYDASRYSHGMMPVLPDQMAAWNKAGNDARAAAGLSSNYYEGQDSCTKCHPGATPDQLSQDAETWQADAAAEATQVAAAITAAESRPEFSMTDSSMPGYQLVGRACWNYEVYRNDASGGIHNPPYEMAGLKKAAQLAESVGGRFAFFSGSVSVLPGGTGFISGKVVNGDGTPAVGASIELSTGATTTSDANGGFTFIITQSQTSATSYTATWHRSSVSSTDLTSATVTVKLAKYSSKTTIARSHSTIKLHKKVKIYGKVKSSGKVSGKVTIQYRKGTKGAWKSVKRSTTGTYAKTFKPGSKGTWYYKASYSGTNTVSSSKSGTVKVKVK